tara:strand:- start:1077 stop:1904 length:828 start_codon:yes stop_codon:yes gene_type:complete
MTKLRLNFDMKSKITDKKTLISVSGGRTSGFMLHKILEDNNGLPENAKVVFANTGREMPETLDFVNEISSKWNVNITWLEYVRKENKVGFEVVNHNSASRNGLPLATLFESRNYLPNAVQRFCTQETKVLTIKRFLVSIGWKNWINTVGIRGDEAHRVKISTDKRWQNWYPLHDAKITQKDVLDFWNNQSFDLKVMKGAGNCDGCFLKSEATLSAMFRNEPERMQWWIEQEKKIKSTMHKSRSYQEIANFVENQGDFIFNDEEFLCQKDDGECSG